MPDSFPTIADSAIAYAKAHAHQRGDILGQIKANRHHDTAAALQAEAEKR